MQNFYKLNKQAENCNCYCSRLIKLSFDGTPANSIVDEKKVKEKKIMKRKV